MYMSPRSLAYHRLVSGTGCEGIKSFNLVQAVGNDQSKTHRRVHLGLGSPNFLPHIEWQGSLLTLYCNMLLSVVLTSDIVLMQ